MLPKNRLKFAHDQLEEKYNANKEIRIKTLMLRSDLCGFSDAYIVVKGTITLEVDNGANKRNKNLAFKNNAPFINCISKINGVQIDNADDLNVVMPIYNLNKKLQKNNRQLVKITTEMSQVVLFLLILNLLNTRQVL